jgi:hypothetical protein
VSSSDASAAWAVDDVLGVVGMSFARFSFPSGTRYLKETRTLDKALDRVWVGMRWSLLS